MWLCNAAEKNSPISLFCLVIMEKGFYNETLFLSL